MIVSLVFYQAFGITSLFQVLFDEQLSKYVNESISYQVAMDLLYEKECYEDVIKIMKFMKSLPKSCIILTLAANYKIVSFIIMF